MIGIFLTVTQAKIKFSLELSYAFTKFKYNGCSFYIAHKGIQHNVRASRILNLERLDTVVGPIEVKVIEPLQKLKC